MNNSLLNILQEVDNRTAQYIDRRPIPEWAQDEVVLPSGYSQPGRFSIAGSRYMEEPLRALGDRNTKVAVCLKSVKTGGTLINDVAVANFIAERPGPIQMIYQTEKQAKDHVKGKLFPLFRNTPSLGSILPRDDKYLTKDGIQLPHMTLYVGGPTDSFLQNKDVMIQFADECWEWGTKLQWAQNRLAAFSRKNNSLWVLTSQAGEEGSLFEKIWKQTTQEEWSVPCLSCGEYNNPVWENIKFDTTSSFAKVDGEYQYKYIADTIRYECPRCKHLHLDSVKLKGEWNRRGKYITTNPNHIRGYRGFHWNSIIVEDWYDLVIKLWLPAIEVNASGGGPEKILEFFQSRMAKFTYSAKRKDAGDDLLIDNVAYSDEEWKDEVLRLMAIDVQDIQGVYWVGIRGFRSNGDSRLIWYGQVVTEGDLVSLQEKYKIPANCVFLDVGHAASTMGYPLLSRNGWIGLKGDGKHDSYNLRSADGTLITSYYSDAKKQVINNKECKWIFFAAQSVSGLVQQLLKKKSKVTWLTNANKEYHNQLKKVRREQKIFNGVEKWVWSDSGQAHAFDVEKMLLVGALLHKKKITILKHLYKAESKDVVMERSNYKPLIPQGVQFEDEY